MATYVAKGQRKVSRDLSLVIKTVLQCAPKLEIRVEIIHIAADELPIGIGYECRRIRRQEGSRLSAVGRDQSGSIVTLQPGDDITRQERCIVESDSSANHTLVIERVSEAKPWPEVRVVGAHQSAVLSLQTSLTAGTPKRAQARPCNQRIGIGHRRVKSPHSIEGLRARIGKFITNVNIQRQSRRYLDVVIGEEGRREVPPRRLDRMNIHEGKLGRTSDQARDGPTHVALPCSV